MPSLLLNSSTDGAELVAAKAGYFIRVVGFDVTSDGAGTFGLDSKDAAGTRTTIYLTNGTLNAGGGVVRPPFDDWQLDTAVGSSLVLKASGAGFKGALTYAYKTASGN